MIRLLDGAIEKTSHKPLLPNVGGIGRFVAKHYKALAVVLVIMIFPAFYGYNHVNVYYDMSKVMPPELKSVIANKKLEETFDMATTHLLLVDSDVSQKDVRDMAEEMRQVDGVRSVIGIDSLLGAGIPESIVPDDVLSLVKGERYQLMLINSSYGRAFKAIRENEIAAEAMGINLARHKMLSFCISSFFAGVAGAGMAMVLGIAQANNFKSAMTYEILLMVVLGGIGSISGSVIGATLFIAASEWWLRGLDNGSFLGIEAPGIFRNGFRLVVFSVVIMVVVLFFRKGIMGDKELTDLPRLLKRRSKTKEVAK